MDQIRGVQVPHARESDGGPMRLDIGPPRQGRPGLPEYCRNNRGHYGLGLALRMITGNFAEPMK
jgi:hypothetical protein